MENVRSDVSLRDDNVSDTILRLDEKYANPAKVAKVVDSIVTEIQNFRKLEEHGSKFITFVVIIGRGNRDLMKIDLEQKICNSHVLMIREWKLPKDIQIEEYRLIHEQNINVEDTVKEFSAVIRFF